MEQFTIYVDETIPMIITDTDVTQMANDVMDYINKWTRQYNSNDISSIARHILWDFLKTFAMINQVVLQKKSLKSIICSMKMKI